MTEEKDKEKSFLEMEDFDLAKAAWEIDNGCEAP